MPSDSLMPLLRAVPLVMPQVLPRVSLHPRRWRLAPATLVIQAALLAAGQVLLDDTDAWVQLGMAAVATAAMHLGACAVMARRLRCANHDLHG